MFIIWSYYSHTLNVIIHSWISKRLKKLTVLVIHRLWSKSPNFLGGSSKTETPKNHVNWKILNISTYSSPLPRASVAFFDNFEAARVVHRSWVCGSDSATYGLISYPPVWTYVTTTTVFTSCRMLRMPFHLETVLKCVVLRSYRRYAVSMGTFNRCRWRSPTKYCAR